MANVIKFKRSSTPGASPTLSEGEFAVNLVDKRLFTANSSAVFDAIQNTASSFAITGTSVALRVGNSTVNLVANSTMIKISNSTVNTGIQIPTSFQYSGNYFLHANGSWVEIDTSGGEIATRIYEKFEAEASQNTFTIIGTFSENHIDVFYNGVHLPNTDYNIVNNSTIQLTEDAIEGAIVEIVGLSNVSITELDAFAAGSNTLIQFNDSGSMGGATGFTYNKTNQNVSMSNNLTVGSLSIGSNVSVNTSTIVVGNAQINSSSLVLDNVITTVFDYSSSNTNAQVMMSFDKTVYRTAVHEISISSGLEYQTSTVKVIHDGSNAYITEINIIETGSTLATFNANVVSNTVNLIVNPVNASTTFRIQRTLFKV